MKVDKLRHFRCFVSTWNAGRTIVEITWLVAELFLRIGGAESKFAR
jgi:hypothetical protein